VDFSGSNNVKKRVVNVCIIALMLGVCTHSAKDRSDIPNSPNQEEVEEVLETTTAVAQVIDCKPELIVKESDQFKAYFSYANDSLRICDESFAECKLSKIGTVKCDGYYEVEYSFNLSGSIEGLYSGVPCVDTAKLDVINPYLVDIAGQQMIVEDAAYQSMQDKYYKLSYKTDSDIKISNEVFQYGIYSADIEGTVTYHVKTTEPSSALGLIERTNRVDLTPQAVRIRHSQAANSIYGYTIIRLPKGFSKEDLCRDV
jgi:hypothetical protein